MSEKKTIAHLHPDDNVLVALKDLPKGTTITHNGNLLVLAQDIEAKHKFSIKSLNIGDEVIEK